MRKLFFSITSMLFVLLLAACGGSGANEKPKPEPPLPSDIYLAGFVNFEDGRGAAAQWVSNAETLLSKLFDPNSEEMQVTGGAGNSVYASGSDVYVAGQEWDFHLEYQGDDLWIYAYPVPMLWKNGGAHRLSGEKQGGDAKQVVVAGDDVYVVGYVINNNEMYIPTLWKNGNAMALEETMYGFAESVFLSGGDVYVTGFAYEHVFPDLLFQKRAMLWKNGVLQYPQLTYNDLQTNAHSVFVSGNDIYVAGERTVGSYFSGDIEISFATLWKNGVAMNIDAGDDSYANSVFVSGEDVYVAGWEFNQQMSCYDAKLWKNGVPQTLTGKYGGHALSVVVAGDDVYVAGCEFYNRDHQHAIVWKNGVGQQVSSVHSESTAKSVFIKQN